MQRMWLQNNVQEKDKKMYPFTRALACIWEAMGRDKVYTGNRMEDLSNYVRIFQGQKMHTVEQSTIGKPLQCDWGSCFLS